MIVLDIETSGINTGKCGIWQIGALELENPKNYFLQEGRIDDEDSIEEMALIVTGKTETELRNRKKQSQRQLIINYLDWIDSVKEKMFTGQNVGWDISFIQNKCINYGLMDRFREVQSQRSSELHTLAQDKYFQIHGHYLVDEKGKSKMNLSQELEFCNLPDERINVTGENVVKEGKSHNALEDCMLEGEIFSRLRDGRNLFQEYKKFKIPAYLIKSSQGVKK